jgi:6-pyruvoyltetrahydropterin/6-carboxytetrahydropterin synthase
VIALIALIALTRRYEFPAAHILCHPAFSDAENRRIYGKCANPNGHGHDYGVEVTVSGPIDAKSGRIIEPAVLDAIFAERIHSRFAHRTLNEDEAFRERVPTAENIARLVHEELAPAIADRSTAHLVRVRVRETRKNSFAYGAMA